MFREASDLKTILTYSNAQNWVWAFKELLEGIHIELQKVGNAWEEKERKIIKKKKERKKRERRKKYRVYSNTPEVEYEYQTFRRYPCWIIQERQGMLKKGIHARDNK